MNNSLYGQNKFGLTKNGDHIPSSLGGRSVVVVIQAGRQMIFSQFTKIFKFTKFNSINARLGCLNGFMVLMALY